MWPGGKRSFCWKWSRGRWSKWFARERGLLIGFSSLPGSCAGSTPARPLIGPSPGEGKPDGGTQSPREESTPAMPDFRRDAAARGQHREPRVMDRRVPDPGHPVDLRPARRSWSWRAEADRGGARDRSLRGGARRRAGLGGHRRRRHHDGLAGDPRTSGSPRASAR